MSYPSHSQASNKRMSNVPNFTSAVATRVERYRPEPGQGVGVLHALAATVDEIHLELPPGEAGLVLPAVAGLAMDVV